MADVPRFCPAPHRILVKKTDALLNEPSKIIRPETAEEECAAVGIVMQVGLRDPDAPPFTLEVGDTVLYHTHEAMDIQLDGEIFQLLSMDSVLGKLADEPVFRR